MTQPINPVIRAAFDGRLTAWAAAQLPPIPIAHEGLSFEPPATGPYLRAFLMPGETQNPSIGTAHSQRLGIFQVSVCTSDTPGGSAMVEAEAIAESIVALYPRGLKLSGALVNFTPSIATPIVNAGKRTIPVSIRYLADVFTT